MSLVARRTSVLLVSLLAVITPESSVAERPLCGVSSPGATTGDLERMFDQLELTTTQRARVADRLASTAEALGPRLRRTAGLAGSLRDAASVGADHVILEAVRQQLVREVDATTREFVDGAEAVRRELTYPQRELLEDVSGPGACDWYSASVAPTLCGGGPILGCR